MVNDRPVILSRVLLDTLHSYMIFKHGAVKSDSEFEREAHQVGVDEVMHNMTILLGRGD